ncbi:MAG: amino acid ABC transporter substrate-binding protein [Proteobacteria bacterium]|nr:amino acid ABC transporter substrate-binding protein [Pseudomonadota bacterium]MBU1738869.1 amino acid ABC transporter substrate-binding protein [Pseudomonadota bacterium]
MNISVTTLLAGLARIAVFQGVLLLLVGWAPSSSAASAETSFTPEQILSLGEKMYREGILPSGEPMKAFVSGDIPVSGASFTCVSCHLRSGLGSVEGEIATPPTNGRILYAPRESYIKGFEHVPSFHNYAVYFQPRPAYTDESLAELISGGIDPSGRSVKQVMPIYDLGDQEMAILIAYLKTLSDQPSPGVSDGMIRFATVIVEGADPLAVESMIAPIEFAVSRKNSLTTASEANDRVGRMGYNMLGPDLLKKRFSLARWTLKGPADTWRAQLDAYYQAEPVFAILGGISNGDWEPIHRFCEENRIPNLLPIVDYPVLSDTDWYTLYLSRGVRLEGETAARYLHGMYDLFNGRAIVQVSRDSRKGQAMAAGFNEIWAGAGHPAAVEIILKEGEQFSGERLRKIIAELKPAALLVWDDASALAAFEGLADIADRPGVIVASGTDVGKSLWEVPEQLRDLLYFTYPYRLPQEDARYDISVRKVLVGKPAADYDSKIVKQSNITNELLGKALMDMRGEYYRDFFLDVIGMMRDQYYPLYERVSFGPGQRYASKGCFVVQLGKGDQPQLERRSEWVLQ